MPSTASIAAEKRPGPLAWLDDELARLDAASLRRTLADRHHRQGGEVQIGAERLINFGSNDYLGCAGLPLPEAAESEARQAGRGSGASPLVTGHSRWHRELELALAEFEGTESALLFSSGYAANLGVISALAGKGDVVLSDAKNHASLIDGCRLSQARVQVYPHCDVAYLRMMLAQAGGFRRRFIVTDGLFSMDGDLAPLDELSRLADQFDAVLIVDEAHATGVFGERGRGVAEHFGVEQAIPVRIGTLSKALGCVGGFVVGERRLIDWLTNRARSLVFSTALPDVVAAVALDSLRMVREQPWRRERLRDLAARVRLALAQQGWNLGCSQSQIIPVMIGEPAATLVLARALRERGCFVPGIRPPSVPEGESLLRISLTAAHTNEQADRLVSALAELGPGADRSRGPTEK